MKYDTAAGTSWKGYPFKTLQEAKVSCEAIGTRLATIVELEDAFAESVAQHSDDCRIVKGVKYGRDFFLCLTFFISIFCHLLSLATGVPTGARVER